MSKPMKPKTTGLSAGPTAYWDARSDAAKDAEIERLRVLLDRCLPYLFGDQCDPELAGKIDRLREENERLRFVLVGIRDSEYCSYEKNGESYYAIGRTDGHRHCSRLARKALEKQESEVRDE